MHVTKRDGTREAVSFDKVLQRIRKSSRGLVVNPDVIAQQILGRIVDGIKTSELDELTAQMAASLCTQHPDWGVLASRIVVSNHHKSTEARFSAVIELLANQRAPKTGEPVSYLAPHVVKAVRENAAAIDERVKSERDYQFDYFGFKTLEKAYLLRDTAGRVLERPQYMWMRVAVGMWAPREGEVVDGWLERAFDTYEALSLKKMTHATPTLFNAGLPRAQCSSCYLLSMSSDSITGIFKTLGDCAIISKYSGGIGLHIHNIRARGSLIHGTNGTSNGLVPMLRVFNNTARFSDQGGGRRNGSFAIYLEPWHADVEDFLKLKLNTGAEEERARDLFYAMWVPDLFMKRVEDNADWSLFCPNEAPGLADVWGAAFEELYERYEREGRARKVMSARKLWFQILDTQMETGTPYILYKDAANAKSNQQNLGTIKSSNLCVAPETYVLTDKGQFQIQELEGKEVNVWNGERWSKTIVRKTGSDQPVIAVDILLIKNQAGEETITKKRIECTPYHKFIRLSDDSIVKSPRVEAKDLKRGVQLMGWTDSEGVTHDAIVWRVEDLKRKCDTYCFNEPENHAGVFNGVLTGNCTEIIEYSSPEETAVCNLASIALPAYVRAGTDGAPPTYDFDELRSVVMATVHNLNRIIDINFYPTPETERSNMRHRPIGLGVQGLADVFAMMGLAWEDAAAADLNQRIFEHIYYAALKASALMAGGAGPYETYPGSPASKGKLQFDLWSGAAEPLTQADGTLDWASLRGLIAQHGLRNSLLVAPMPTASTSQILGYNECFEPFTSNLYTRRTLAGEFIVINKHLMRELMAAGLWSEGLKQKIVANNGSVQSIDEIPGDLKRRYKTAWEIPQKVLIDMAAARGAFICQSQSLNLFVAEPTIAKLTSMHFYAWKAGLKTGCYYLRTKAPVAAQKFTVDPRLLAALAGGGTGTHEGEDDDGASTVSDSEIEDSDSEDSGALAAPAVPVQTAVPIQETRQQKLERLAREFEEEQSRAKAAADSGEGCLYCSA